jgi:hypothetical protein
MVHFWTFELKNGLKIKDDRQYAVLRARKVVNKTLARISVGRIWFHTKYILKSGKDLTELS